MKNIFRFAFGGIILSKTVKVRPNFYRIVTQSPRRKGEDYRLFSRFFLLARYSLEQSYYPRYDKSDYHEQVNEYDRHGQHAEIEHAARYHCVVDERHYAQLLDIEQSRHYGDQHQQDNGKQKSGLATLDIGFAQIHVQANETAQNNVYPPTPIQQRRSAEKRIQIQYQRPKHVCAARIFG